MNAQIDKISQPIMSEKGIEDIPFLSQTGWESARDLITEQSVKAWLMPPRNQGLNGNSISYALTAAFEFYINLESNYKTNLSPDYIDFHLRKGQTLVDALDFLKKKGL